MGMGKFLRNYATPLSLVAFAAIAATGVMMLVGIHSHPLHGLHELGGIAFVVIAILHIMRNKQSFSLMLSQTRSKLVIGILGTLAVLFIGSAAISDGGAGPHGRRGPGGPDAAIAQRLSYAPIAQLAPAFGLSSSQVITRLRKGGITVSGPDQNLADISQKQGVPVPQLISQIIAEPGQPPADVD
jgi:hypothetical protein